MVLYIYIYCICTCMIYVCILLTNICILYVYLIIHIYIYIITLCIHLYYLTQEGMSSLFTDDSRDFFSSLFSNACGIEDITGISGENHGNTVFWFEIWKMSLESLDIWGRSWRSDMPKAVKTKKKGLGIWFLGTKMGISWGYHAHFSH